MSAAKDALEYVGEATKEEFRQKTRDRDGVNYKLIVIGEASNRLGRDSHSQHPKVPWSDMMAMRNIVAHQYGRVDPAIVWDVVTTRFGQIIAYITNILGSPTDDKARVDES